VRFDPPEVLQSVERTLDAPTELVEAFAEGERALPIDAVGNDWLGSTLIQFVAQFIVVVGLVADWAIVCLTAGQEDGNETPLSICQCMNLRVAAAARGPTARFCSPLFRPMPSDVL
jgi:hypothetical protein